MASGLNNVQVDRIAPGNRVARSVADVMSGV